MTEPAVTTDPAALTAAALQWWALAGVDVAVQDMPRDWLAKPRPTERGPATSAPILPPVQATGADMTHIAEAKQAEAPVPVSMPDTLDRFLEWLGKDPAQPEARFSQQRLVPLMAVAPAILVVTDMPTQDDMTAQRLFSGPDAKLLAAMMRATGMDMDKVAMASLLLARPTGGIMDDKLVQQATIRLKHLIRLMNPGHVLLLGDRTSRAMDPTNSGLTGLSSFSINLDDGSVSALSLPAPFVLLKHPERKAAAWAQLRHLAK